MRKFLLFTSSVVLFSSLTFAQSLQLTDVDGVDISSGSTLYYWTDTNKIEINLYVKNISSNKLSAVRLIHKNINVIQGTENCWCWDVCPVECYDTSGTVSLNVGASNLLIPHYAPGANLGASTIRYTIFDDTNLDDSIFVNIVFTSTPSNVKEKSLRNDVLEDVFPNPASNLASIRYDLEGDFVKRKITFYDMLGNSVKEIALTSNSQGKVSVNTSDMPNGLYFYSLSGTSVARKLLVSH